MDKVIFITGTSSGLGKTTAKHFAAMGWKVAATMRNPSKETELTHLNNVSVFKMDVTDPASVKQAIADAIDTFGQIDIVVNNAGIGRYGALEMVTDNEIDEQWNTNVRGVINVIRETLPHFRATGAGMFINVGSVVGLTTGMPLGSLYSTSKFALEGLSESLYYELKPLNIEIRLVEPGGFKSEFNSNVVLRRDDQIKGYEMITDKIEHMLNHVNDSPSGTAQDTADVIFNLATRKNDFFRTVIGADSLSLMELRNSLPIEDYLEAVLKSFN